MKNWMRRITADGVIFYAPEGKHAALVRVRERVRPLRRLRDLRADHLASLGGLNNLVAGPTQRVVTNEGEDAFLYGFTAEDGNDWLQVNVGVIYGPDFYVTVESLCSVREMGETVSRNVANIVRTMPLGLGQLRYRRYIYTPPPDWQPIVKPHAVSWYPKDFPHHRAVIRVFDAVPAKLSKSLRMLRMVFDEPQHNLATVTDTTTYELATDQLMRGYYDLTRGTWLDGAPSVFIYATLADESYAYYMRLEASEPYIDSAREVFNNSVRSIISISRPPLDSEAVGRLIHWAE